MECRFGPREAISVPRSISGRVGGCEERSDFPTARIMLDNCLLYGLDDLARGRSVFLTSTRETLLSGFLSLMPRSIIYEIPESVEAEDEVVSACRKLKSEGFRLALDNFESLDAMEEFLDLVHFIKVDFRHAARRKRVSMLRRLHLTDAALVAENVDSEEDFRQALDEGFELCHGVALRRERRLFEQKRQPGPGELHGNP